MRTRRRSSAQQMHDRKVSTMHRLAVTILDRTFRASTVLEQDHFYSDFLLSQTTVSTNFNHLEDEARHSLDRRECSYTWYAALVTFIYHECSTERLGSNFHHMLNLLKVLIAHCAQ